MPYLPLSSLRQHAAQSARGLLDRLTHTRISALHLVMGFAGLILIIALANVTARQLGHPLSELFGDDDTAALRTQLLEMQKRMGAMEELKDQFANLANPLPVQFAPSRLTQNAINPFKQSEIKSLDSLAFAPLSNKSESADTKELLRQAMAFNESLAKAEQRWLGQLKVISQLPTGSPVAKNAGMSSDYGTRIDPFTHTLAYHPGIDFSVGHGSPIMATGDGVVSKVDVDRNNGQYLEIEHASGFTTRYAHVSSFSVRTGETVKRGQVIAAVGNTGRSTGTHLHYEIRYQGVSINPLQALTQTSQQLASTKPTDSRWKTIVDF